MRPCTYRVNPNCNIISLSVHIEIKEFEKYIVPGRNVSNLERIMRIRNYFFPAAVGKSETPIFAS